MFVFVFVFVFFATFTTFFCSVKLRVAMDENRV